MLHGLQYTSDRWKENSFAFGLVWGWQTEQPYFRWVCNRSLCADPTSSKAEDVFPMAAYTNSPIKTCLSILVIIDRHNHNHYSHENKLTSEWPHPIHRCVCLSVNVQPGSLQLLGLVTQPSHQPSLDPNLFSCLHLDIWASGIILLLTQRYRQQISAADGSELAPPILERTFS